MDIEQIEIEPISLYWSDWHPWEYLTPDAQTCADSVTPPNKSGVYEAKLRDQEERLTIGKTSNMRRRMKRGLAQGKLPHSSGKRIRAAEDVTQILVRWAETDRPAAVEEELHRHHQQMFGRLPKHTKRS
jgi:hypothetical protein